MSVTYVYKSPYLQLYEEDKRKKKGADRGFHYPPVYLWKNWKYYEKDYLKDREKGIHWDI